MRSDLHFSVLGPVRLLREGAEKTAGQPRQCAVLVSLLLRAGRSVSLPTLVKDVWGDKAPPSAIGSVRTYIYRLRQALSGLGDSPVQLVDGGYLLRIQPDALDLNCFKQTMAKAREARDSGNLTLAEDLLSKGLDMWKGAALAGVPGPFAKMQRGVLGELRLACKEDHLALQVDNGRYAEAAAELTGLLAEYPLRERICSLLMTALYGAGRQSEALAVYHRTSHLLRQDLGVSPSPELQQVHEHLLSGRLRLPQNTNHPVGQWHAVLPQAPAQLPAALPSLVGREKEREQLERFAHDSEASSCAAICVIDGVAGVGKTAFAIYAGHRLARRFPDGQLFADLRDPGPKAGPKDPAEVLADFLRSLGVRCSSIPETTRGRGLMFRDLLTKRRMLVVLDNADSADQLKDLLPQSPGSMAVVTSRRQLHTLVASYRALPLTLLPLSQDEARSLLSQRLGSARTEAEPEAVDRIIRSAKCHPLALANITARAAYRPKMLLASLADEYALPEHSTSDAFEEDSALIHRAPITRACLQLDSEAASLFHTLNTGLHGIASPPVPPLVNQRLRRTQPDAW